jgi:Arylsulfotransferase (ASST)
VIRWGLWSASTLAACVFALALLGGAAASAGPTRFASRSDLAPPAVQVAGRASADVFLAPKSVNGQSGPMILDPSGRLLWFHPEPRGVLANDFKVQTYQGQPVLTWWEGRTNTRGYGQGEWVIADRAYKEIARVKAGDGLYGDLHDMELTSRGTALITVYHVVRADLSSVGSAADGHAVDSIVQEIDVATGKVLFSWHSLDHVALTESHAGPPAPGHSFPYDYFHVNSVAEEPDGDLLVSGRNTWALYEISRETGDVLWRLGGKRSDFTLGPGVRFAWQHDARRQADGTITVFDNESTPKVGSASRLLRLQVDEAAKTVSVAHAMTHPGGVLADAEGNNQPLADGGVFAGWGLTGRASEFGPRGALTFDLRLPAGYDSYRAFTFAWDGRPADAPALAVTRDGDHVRAQASWNGATEVTRWQLLDAATGRVLGSAKRTSFETTIEADTDASRVTVRALDGDRVLGASRPVATG